MEFPYLQVVLLNSMIFIINQKNTPYKRTASGLEPLLG